MEVTYIANFVHLPRYPWIDMKTQSVLDLLCRIYPKVNTVNAAHIRAGRAKMKKAAAVFVLLSKNGTAKLYPKIYRVLKKEQKKINFIAPGAYLPEFLRQNPVYRRFFAGINRIFVESEGILNELSEMGFENVACLPNFRITNYERTVITVPERKKLLYYGRISEKKGVELAVRAVSALMPTHSIDGLDIYGPIDEGYKKEFSNLIASSSFACYKGILNPAEICVYNVLSKYDLLLFPTHSEGECFSGSILDAFIAGVPVITTDFGHNAEFVRDGETGFLCEPENAESLKEALEKALFDDSRLLRMKSACVDESRKYSLEEVTKIIRRNV